MYDLQSVRYVHSAYEEYSICDPKKRTIHKASVRDRVVYRLVYNALYDYFDRRYIHDSYSCRIGKGTHAAYRRVRHFINRGSKNYTKSCYILKFDIKKCFKSIDTCILKKILARHVEDALLLQIVDGIIDSFKSGLPLGNLTSQLFINMYLHKLDFYVKHTLASKYYLRYADDIVVVSHDKEKLEKLYLDIEFFLKHELHLVTHKKVVQSIYAGVDVLGFVFFAKYCRLRRSTERRAKKKEQ